MKILQAKQLFETMNLYGKQRKPFVFLTDAFAEKGVVALLDEADDILWYKTPSAGNCTDENRPKAITKWEITPVSFRQYCEGFTLIMEHIQRGDSFLLNYTQPTGVSTNLNPEDLFHLSHARYKIHLRGAFTCFSPETFVTIDEHGIIRSHPMKGTADASLPRAEEKLLADSKEIAEHHTIVDLIRNDLSRVADEVKVEKFRYTGRIVTNRQELIQVSSEIKGQLAKGWESRLGDIFRKLLPAGSVTGAPKKRTIEIIRQAEKYERGWYTGIFGLFDGQTVDSAVLIRYIEQENDRLVFKSGGGITFQSDCEREYNEMIGKVYVPLA
jgi:para-aminobenzoate synthetase component I